MTLLSLDTESGGIETACGLLTLTLAIVDKDFNHKETLDLKVKPNPVDNRTNYLVQPEALSINGIDLIEHDKVAMPYQEAKSVIYKWLKTQSEQYGLLTPFGNNVQRDIDLICSWTLSMDSWLNFVSRAVIELHTLGQACKYLDLIPEDQSLSLSKITKYFGVEVDSSRIHSADYDTYLGTELLKCYLNALNKCAE